MIIVQSLTGSTSYTQRFECSAAKIGIVATAAQKNDLLNTYVTILLVDSNGQQKVITPRTKLGDLLEIAASNEGLLQITDNYTSTTLSSYTYKGTIELSNFGAVDLAGGYGQIQLDGCVSTTSWNIYGIDNPQLTSMIIDYRPFRYCSCNSTKLALGIAIA